MQSPLENVERVYPDNYFPDSRGMRTSLPCSLALFPLEAIHEAVGNGKSPFAFQTGMERNLPSYKIHSVMPEDKNSIYKKLPNREFRARALSLPADTSELLYISSSTRRLRCYPLQKRGVSMRNGHCNDAWGVVGMQLPDTPFQSIERTFGCFAQTNTFTRLFHPALPLVPGFHAVNDIGTGGKTLFNKRPCDNTR